MVAGICIHFQTVSVSKPHLPFVQGHSRLDEEFPSGLACHFYRIYGQGRIFALRGTEFDRSYRARLSRHPAFLRLQRRFELGLEVAEAHWKSEFSVSTHFLLYVPTNLCTPESDSRVVKMCVQGRYTLHYQVAIEGFQRLVHGG